MTGKQIDTVFRSAMVLLGAIAFALSMILMFHSLSGQDLIGCTAGGACDAVLGSRWSMVWKLPVSAVSAGLYLSMILCILFLREMEDLVWPLIATSCSIIVVALWMMSLMLFSLKAFCPYCTGAHLAGSALAVLILTRSAGLASRRRKAFSASVLAGILAAVIFIAAQLLTGGNSRYVYGTADAALPDLPSPAELPLVGDPDADQVLELLFDYRCPHCRNVHQWMQELVEESRETPQGRSSLAVILCPTPLSVSCNPYIPEVSEDLFKGSCELARLSLALWRVDNELFRQFDSWLFSSDGNSAWKPRDPLQAREEAERLLEASGVDEELGTLLADPWIDAYMSRCMELFGRTTMDGKSGLPRLVCGSQWLVPEAASREDLAGMLQKEFFSSKHHSI